MCLPHRNTIFFTILYTPQLHTPSYILPHWNQYFLSKTKYISNYIVIYTDIYIYSTHIYIPHNVFSMLVILYALEVLLLVLCEGKRIQKAEKKLLYNTLSNWMSEFESLKTHSKTFQLFWSFSLRYVLCVCTVYVWLSFVYIYIYIIYLHI